VEENPATKFKLGYRKPKSLSIWYHEHRAAPQISQVLRPELQLAPGPVRRSVFARAA